jgi:hypothetical protein
MVELAKTSIMVFDDVVLKDPATLDLVLSDTYCHQTCSIGLVDAARRGC